ncbi:hypothetical protein GCM10028774_61500 [Spirosoma jeollabukense]
MKIDAVRSSLSRMIRDLAENLFLVDSNSSAVSLLGHIVRGNADKEHKDEGR